MRLVHFILAGVFACISLSAKNIAVEQLFASDDLDLSAIPLGAIAGQGLYGAFGNKIVALEHGDNLILTSMTMPDSVAIDEWFHNGEKFVIRQGQTVVWSGLDGRFDGMAFEDDGFSIAAATDSTFYVIRTEAMEVLEISLSTKRPVRVSQLEEPLLAVGKVGAADLFITRHAAYLHLDNETNLLHRHPLELTAGAITPMGIYFGTDYDMWRVTGINTLEHVADGSISRILGAGNLLYVIDTSGNVWRFEM